MLAEAGLPKGGLERIDRIARLNIDGRVSKTRTTRSAWKQSCPALAAVRRR